MSRGLRVALVLVAIALFLCCVAGLGVTLLGSRLVGRAVITNPERVHSVGGQIADYAVPTGYEEMFAMNVMGIRLVVIGPSSSNANFMMIMLMQYPSWIEVSQAEIERQLDAALARQIGLRSPDMQVVGQEPTTIKGESVTLTVREGMDEGGERWRQIVGVFPGNGGPAALVVMGEVGAWDRALVERFIASIR